MISYQIASCTAQVVLSFAHHHGLDLEEVTWFVVQYQVTGILERDQMNIFSKIKAKRSHFIAEMGVLSEMNFSS
ncbi:MAG: hypothetical protein MAG431_00438 [Chloroflexi bacterium]|nr:hypothetical protein [Chloroflexota bacterium]